MMSQRAGKKTRRIYVANLVAQAAIVVTGVTVRLTGSGLGCPTWPECIEGSYTPTARQEEEWHKIVEFGNRTLTFILVILAVAALVAAFVDQRNRVRKGGRRRGVLLALATIPFLGTFAQAILGGITVLTGLSPITVALHLLLSMALIAGCAALVIRSGDEGDAPLTLLVRKEIRVLTWVLLAVTALVIVIGTVVTGSGPHSGDSKAENRFSFDPRVVSWLHADVVILFIGLTIALLLALHLTKAPTQVMRLVWVLIAISLLQAALGYTQYFTGLPIVLVLLHVSGATVLWITMLFIPGRERVRDAVNV
ncbi:MAG: heme A synthase [Actinobacteria bacterium]|nr:heme A synthase [Actinomycetota bacterium]